MVQIDEFKYTLPDTQSYKEYTGYMPYSQMPKLLTLYHQFLRSVIKNGLQSLSQVGLRQIHPYYSSGGLALENQIKEITSLVDFQQEQQLKWIEHGTQRGNNELI